MLQRAFAFLGWHGKDDVWTALPFYLFMTVVVAGMYVFMMASDPSLQGTGQRVFFTGLMLVHLVLHWFTARLAQTSSRIHRWFPLVAYFFVQGMLLFAISLLTTYQAFVAGLYTALAAEAVAILWSNLRAVVLAVCFFVALVALNFVLVWDFDLFIANLPIIAGSLGFAIIYVGLYIRQVQAREDAQDLLQRLEVAHGQLQDYADQVEELTISQERQRMARELHDTLAQGLAGLIMQLEAADSHLESGNPARAQAVVQQATQRARTTLHEARSAIQALRASALEQETLVDVLGREVESFAATTGVQATFEVDGSPPDVPPEMAPEMAQNVLRIVQAALSNVARHAQASQVLVRLAGRDGKLEVLVQDDGVGFDPAAGLGRPGSYGLAGMLERAERMGAVLWVESAPGTGTRVVFELEAEPA